MTTSGGMLQVATAKDLLLHQCVKIPLSEPTKRQQSLLKLKFKITNNNGEREELPPNTKFKVIKSFLEQNLSYNKNYSNELLEHRVNQIIDVEGCF